MSCPMEDREFGCTLGDMVEALYDEVDELPLSDPTKGPLVAIMLGDVMRMDGREIVFLARPRQKTHLDAA